MEQERNIDRLAKHIINLGAFAIIAVLCWYFRSVLIYIIVAFVISLIGQPVFRTLKQITVKGRSAPDWLLSAFTLVSIILILALIVTQVIPIVSGIIRDALAMNNSITFDRDMLDRVNAWIISMFPDVGRDFDIVTFSLGKLKDLTSFSGVSNILGSVASIVASTVIGVFSIVFISFFFIKDEALFGKIVGALVPDRIEESVGKTILDIEMLLSRYFVGLTIEVLGVMLLDFLGLWLIARIGVNYAIGIAFIAGILNVIPYVGPLIGDVIGIGLCLILKYGAGVGLDVNVWIFILIVFAIMQGTQFVDNFIYQPLIYSTSIRANPLEIFIVLLIAGHVGGVVGMLVAIPSYTVIRVIASRFFYKYKPVRRLIPEREQDGADRTV
ncbi:MAG: AI-2E family transporter [Bacteroidales bacterium]|jgi:predicted PurR-regulated permease PerM|nr:AI-2E family transporter [Bacteroidales bacterium]